jgi:sterol desaturase/sphingolipid hydroxylase (fatty acid hydroxylase superfamily)
VTSLKWLQVLQEGQLITVIAGLVVLLAAESLVPAAARRPWRERARHVGRNSALWIVGVLVLSLVMGTLLIGVAFWLEAHRIGVMHLLPLPAWAVFAIGFLALDFGDYVFHRLSHQWRWLWLMHAVHHSDEVLDVSTNLRAHPGHLLATALTKPIVLAAFGIPLWVWLARELVSIPVTQLQHSAIDLPPRLERVLRHVVLTPALHRIHHSPVPAETNSNFGGIVPWWDQLFGTFRSAREDRPGAPRYGLDALRGERWQTLGGMLRTPFSARRYEVL